MKCQHLDLQLKNAINWQYYSNQADNHQIKQVTCRWNWHHPLTTNYWIKCQLFCTNKFCRSNTWDMDYGALLVGQNFILSSTCQCKCNFGLWIYHSAQDMNFGSPLLLPRSLPMRKHWFSVLPGSMDSYKTTCMQLNVFSDAFLLVLFQSSIQPILKPVTNMIITGFIHLHWNFF
jgi:hypothetical protein